jgi:hypothetical protein
MENVIAETGGEMTITEKDLAGMLPSSSKSSGSRNYRFPFVIF